jgi:DNA (cytosine-5)-methyltransferase 1
MQDEIIKGQIELDLSAYMTPPKTIQKEEVKTELPENIRIRKLTPKECYRLMGFTDDDFANAQAVNSNTQLYKQAGNSICVNVLEAIFGQLFEGKEDHWKRWLEERCYEDSH